MDFHENLFYSHSYSILEAVVGFICIICVPYGVAALAAPY
jgi:hypothetical protein